MNMSSKCSQCSHSFLQGQIPHVHLSTRHQFSPHSTTQDSAYLLQLYSAPYCKFSLGSPQLPPCNETTTQPLSFLQAHPPDLPQPFSQVSAHPQGPALTRPQDIHHSTDLQMTRKSKSDHDIVCYFQYCWSIYGKTIHHYKG